MPTPIDIELARPAPAGPMAWPKGQPTINIGASTMFTNTVIICRIMVGFIMPVARNVANIATIGNCSASPGANQYRYSMPACAVASSAATVRM